MKWLYIAFGLVGAVTPIIWVYLAHLPLARAMVDLGLLVFALGLGLMFTPVGAVGGLALAALVHLT